MFFQTFVNPEKRTIVVKGDEPMKELQREFNMFFAKYGLHWCYFVFDEFYSKYADQINKIVGVAQCNEDFGDIFDEDFGYELAKERYMHTFEAYRTKMYQMIFKHLNNTAKEAAKRVEASVIRRIGREDNINDLIDSLKEKSDN